MVLKSPKKALQIGSLALATLVCSGLSIQAQANNSYAQTRYPVVLVHGFLGYATEKGGNEYWYNVAEDLTSHGAYVYTAQVDPLNNDAVRGEELLQQMQQVMAITGASKVNLIGHSQGGLTSRYVAAIDPQNVASVTALGTPNYGSKSADVIQNINQYAPLIGSAVYGILNAYSSMIDNLSGGNFQLNGAQSLTSLSSAGAAAFNASYPQGLPTTNCGQGAPVVNGVHYYSWGGTQVNTNFWDYTDYALDVTSLAFLGAPSDGVVGQCSTHLGQVIYDRYPMNHLDLVNQTNGLHSWRVDPVALIRNQVNRLKNTGL